MIVLSDTHIWRPGGDGTSEQFLSCRLCECCANDFSKEYFLIYIPGMIIEYYDSETGILRTSGTVTEGEV